MQPSCRSSVRALLDVPHIANFGHLSTAYCWGNFTGPFVVKQSQAPNFPSATAGLLAGYAIKTGCHLMLLGMCLFPVTFFPRPSSGACIKLIHVQVIFIGAIGAATGITDQQIRRGVRKRACKTKRNGRTTTFATSCRQSQLMSIRSNNR